MKAMALDIEKLKWRLIEQDQEAERQRRGGRLALKKSRSLEEESAGKGRRESCACVRHALYHHLHYVLVYALDSCKCLYMH